jgi:hypothetical protein
MEEAESDVKAKACRLYVWMLGMAQHWGSAPANLDLKDRSELLKVAIARISAHSSHLEMSFHSVEYSYLPQS